MSILKWYYGYDYTNKKIISDYRSFFKENITYFRTEEEMKDFITKYNWQIKHELGVK